MPPLPDKRLNAYRPDLADERLRGLVAAQRYVAGRSATITVPCAPMRRSPDATAALDTEALYGEVVEVYERRDGWAWVQLATDRYVGYVPEAALGEPGPIPTHVIAAPETFVFPRPDIKVPPLMRLPLGAMITVRTETERFLELETGGFVYAKHARTPNDPIENWVRVAEQFIGTPYLWGGRSRHGIDCSGLVQVCLLASGRSTPRDSDMQREALGAALPIHTGLDQLARGDLVFWPGHVGIVRDHGMLLHANAHHMMTVAEPLQDVVTRSLEAGVPIAAIKRLGSRT